MEVRDEMNVEVMDRTGKRLVIPKKEKRKRER